MSRTDKLFVLIHSMTKLEKRHFKLFTEGYGDNNNYMRLFDAINSQKAYNEEKILRLFKGETFTKQPHVLKNYLYHLILKSLKTFHANKTTKNELRSLLNDYDILMDKKLFDQAEKMLEKARAIAESNENFNALLEIFDLEETFMTSTYNMARLSAKQNEIRSRRKEILEKIQNVHEYKQLQTHLLMLHHTIGRSREEKIAEEYKKALTHPLLQSIDSALSDASIGFYHHILTLCYSKIGDHKKCLYHLIQEKKFIESSPSRRKRYRSEYIGTLSNILFVGRKRIGFEKISGFGNEYKELALEDPQQRDRILQTYYIIMLDVYVYYGKLNDLHAFIEEANTWHDETDILTLDNTNLAFYHRMSYAHFCLGNFKRSLFWLNKVLNYPDKKNMQMDAYCALQVFNLILHYELRNEELLTYITRSVFRFLIKKEKLYRYEFIVLSFIRKTMLNFADHREQAAEFKKLRSELLPLTTDEYEKKPFEYFDLIAWLDSKISKTDFATAVRKNRYK